MSKKYSSGSEARESSKKSEMEMKSRVSKSGLLGLINKKSSSGTASVTGKKAPVLRGNK